MIDVLFFVVQVLFSLLKHDLELSALLLLLCELLFLLADLVLSFGDLCLFLLQELVMVLLLFFEPLLPEAHIHQREVDQVVDRGSLALLQVQHPADYALELLRVAGRYPLELALLDLHGQGHGIQRLKRRMQRAELVNNAAERPNVTFLVVLLVVDLLWRHVVGRANVGECELRFIVKHPGQSEVAQFHVAVQIEEDVAGFEVAVQDFLRERGRI